MVKTFHFVYSSILFVLKLCSYSPKKFILTLGGNNYSTEKQSISNCRNKTNFVPKSIKSQPSPTSCSVKQVHRGTTAQTPLVSATSPLNPVV